MSQRTFQFRLRSSHAAPDRATASLVVEFLAESGEWQPQTPSLTTPGFRLDLLSLLLCQHHDLVSKAQERGIPLRQVEGTFTGITSADWILEQVSGDFRLQLEVNASGEEQARADAESMASIIVNNRRYRARGPILAKNRSSDQRIPLERTPICRVRKPANQGIPRTMSTALAISQKEKLTT